MQTTMVTTAFAMTSNAVNAAKIVLAILIPPIMSSISVRGLAVAIMVL